MRDKCIVISAIAAALLFVAGVGGCNRDGGRTALRSNKNRQIQSVRPAEVLSASAFRPLPRASQPLPPPVAPLVYGEYAMLPPSSVRTAAVPMPTPTGSPALAMARPAMYAASSPAAPVLPEPVVHAVPSAPVRAVVIAMAPIPELEPARAYRLPVRRTGNRPVAEVMISERPPVSISRQEIVRALAPVAVVPAPQAWVASPVTAMTTSRAGY